MVISTVEVALTSPDMLSQGGRSIPIFRGENEDGSSECLPMNNDFNIGDENRLVVRTLNLIERLTQMICVCVLNQISWIATNSTRKLMRVVELKSRNAFCSHQCFQWN